MDWERRAKQLFVHYMELIWNEQGVTVDSDNVAEWEDVIDCIILAAVDAAVERVKREELAN